MLRREIDPVILAGAVIMLVDTAWGALLALGLDLGRINELVLAISFVLSFPVYLLDVWIDAWVPLAMLGLFVFRWIARCFAGATPGLVVDPWRGSVLLMVAFALLQFSQLRRGARRKQVAP